MIKIILTVGIPSAGKSSWAIQEVNKDPTKTVRLNRDSLRNMLNGYVFTDKNEKLVSEINKAGLTAALKAGFEQIILDETNLDKRNFTSVCKIAKEANVDCMVIEKHFYIDLEKALERNSKREGRARVPDEIIHKHWKKSGKEQFKFYHTKTEIFKKRDYCLDVPFVPMAQDVNKPQALVCDLDGTLALFAGKRSPYNPSNCDLIDEPNIPVLTTLKTFYDQNYKLIFCTGREDKYEPESRRFIENCLGHKDYILLMRKSDDHRKDFIVKTELFEEYIKDQYYVLFVLDDRNQVVNDCWRKMGLTCFQVAPGDF